jgi:phospholipid/cholesterol/gamma-HCH transport system substrate-binding protein
VHRDARLTIRPVSLLGERYLDLDRGSPDTPVLAPGEALPSSQTEQPPDLDQILNALDDPTAGALGATVSTLGEGMQGNGANADAAIVALAPALGDTEELVSVLEGQTELLTRLIENAEPVAGALATEDGQRLDQLVTSADMLLATTADRQEALEATLIEMPSTLAAARAALEDLAGVTRSTTPSLRAMRPVTDDLSEISAELQRFADSADPALASADPVLERAAELLAAARPVTAALRPAGPDLRGTAGALAPVVNEFADALPSFWSFIEGWALTTNGHDGLSHYFRALVTVNTDQITRALPPAAPLIDGNPDEDGAAGLPLPGITPEGAPMGGILQPGSGADGGVTGLDPEQEGDALSYLLGDN